MTDVVARAANPDHDVTVNRFQMECRRGTGPSPEVVASGLRAVSGDQAQLPSLRGGLGPVGGAELAQNVGDVLFDHVERHH